MSKEQHDELIQTLKSRFTKNMHRHSGLEWAQVQEKIANHPTALQVLLEMERTGGEPDVIGYAENTGEFIFCDCAAESPTGRRSLCYDQDALDARKENKPAGNAVAMAASMGIELLSEEQYRALQTLGTFDRKTSSWINTPDSIRKLGGALFCDRRYDHVFTYHNGADSYYSVRGFRGRFKV